MASGAVKPRQPIQFYTAGTPNGQVVSILLEELKAVYKDFDYEAHSINLDKKEQKKEDFLRICPNGRIPAMVDPNRNGFSVFETSAILQYMVVHYDPEGHFHFRGQPDLESEIIQWMFWAHGGLAPMQGQSNHFQRYAPEKIQYAMDRYLNETKRLYDVLENRLKHRDYLVGEGKGKYSIADIKCVSWVFWGPFAGVMPRDKPPAVQAWQDRIYARPAVQIGLHVPKHHDLTDKLIDPDFESKYAKHADEEAAKNMVWIQEGMKNDRRTKE